MNSRTRMLLFTIFAPITVPGYLLFLAASNLLGAAYYIVFEATISPLARRPISLTRGQMIMFALPVLAVAPIAAAGHFLIALFRGVGRALCALGNWQTGVTSRGWSFAYGLFWIVAATWTTMMCFNAAMGMNWIGRGIDLETRNKYVDAIRRGLYMDELPPEMQERRLRIIAELDQGGEALSPYYDLIAESLKNDGFPFNGIDKRLRSLITKLKIGGLPWYFMPKEVAPDGLDHSKLLLGPLLFVWMLLIRWPGTLAVLRFKLVWIAWFLVRTCGVVLAIYLLATWVPRTACDSLWPNIESLSRIEYLFSPAAWMGMEFIEYAQPAWYMFNAGLWLVLIGLVSFIWWTAWRVSPFLGWPRYYVAFLASRALLQRKRIAFFSVGAVTLCVAMMVIVISVMGGFVDSIRSRADGLLGDLVLDGSLQGFPIYTEFIAALGELKDEKTGEPIVEQATPLIYSYGILQFPATKFTKAVRIWGIRLDEYVRVNEFGKELFYNNRYGDTRLDIEQGQPVFGFNAARRAALPGDMDNWYREKWLPSLSAAKREEEERLYPRDGGRFMGPGVFAPASNEQVTPDYEGAKYPGIIIGRDVLFRRMPSGEYGRTFDYPRGELCLLTVIPMTRAGNIVQQAPPQPAYRYVDDSKTGIHEIDSMNVYVDFDRLQKLLNMNAQEREEGGTTSPRCNQIQIKLKPKFAWPRDVLLEKKKQVERCWVAVAANTPMDPIERQMVDNTGIETWEDMQASFIAAIEKEKFLVLIMFGVISIVAVLLILCIFYMIVQEKTRDIGIIKSVGASTEGVIAVFLVYGAAIGLVGAIIGSLLGTTFVEHINEIQDWLARINPAWRVWSPETYSFDKIPSVWKWNEVIGISVLSMVASIVGAAFPAMRAGKTWPVEALRYE
ncbi:MAG: FtsX-like permease family protein [Planctomycetes bacterium]|nr:FtsX-like permease family protein [Planctomycetota bacterium]